MVRALCQQLLSPAPFSGKPVFVCRLLCAPIQPAHTGSGKGCAQAGQRHGRPSVPCKGTLPGAPSIQDWYAPTLPPKVTVTSSGATGAAPTVKNGSTAEVPVANGNSGALAKSDFPKFVQFFRQASPYIAGHRGRTFVIVIPGNVTCNRQLLQTAMSDIALLHDLGVRVVVVAGIQTQIDAMLAERNKKPAYVGGYRVTDRDALKVAVEAAGQVRTLCEQILSKGPAIPMIRRHTKGEGEIHFEPALRVISGNYVTAKRRGVLDGVDFGFTGEVRFVMKEDICRQLDGGNLVLLSNLGFTAAGEVLNCNTYDVGLQAAIGLGADKIFFYHLDDVSDMNLPRWLPLSDAQDLLLEKLKSTVSMDQVNSVLASLSSPEMESPPTEYPASPRQLPQQAAAMQASRVASRIATKQSKELLVDLDVWTASGCPPGVATCVIACCKGVKRAHLIDARLDGGLLLELYSRDGVGTMISTDFYEGIRKAGPGDLDALAALLRPLEEAGVLVKRSKEELANMMQDFTIIERETKVLGCALLLPLGPDADGNVVAELGAFCVDPAFRGSGRGDSLLDYVEQDARQRGVHRLVLLTTRTADWFEQRDFRCVGPAFGSPFLPESRRARVNPARNSQLYMKYMESSDGVLEPGKRIGF